MKTKALRKGAEKPASWKGEKLKEASKLIDSHSTIALLNMQNLPAAQLHVIRGKLKAHAKVFMTKKNILIRALEKAKNPKAKELIEKIQGMPALLLSDVNPFELYNIIKKNRSDAPAKAGQLAPNDINVQAGPTPFAPGPVISELGDAGIPAGIEDGKVIIKEDTTVIEEGKEIPAAVASILLRLGIKPMKIGVNLIAALEKDEIFDKSVLGIDEVELLANIQTAHMDSFKLSVETGMINADTAEYLIGKLARESKALALEQNIMVPELKDQILAKTEIGAQALKAKVPEVTEAPAEEKEATTEEPKEEKKEEAPAEENKENNNQPQVEEKTE